VEKTQGYDAYMQYLRFQKLTIINRRPVVGEKGIRYFNFRDGDIYMKGSWILHSLRYSVNNDSLFFDILRSFYMENREKQITSAAFEELVNRKTGKDYRWFFAQYLENRFVPELEYCVDGLYFYYRWNPDYTNRDFAMPARLFTSQTAVTPLLELWPAEKVQRAKLEDGQYVYLEDNSFLVKGTENKKLRKVFMKQGG
jgi:aminopeptidase N